MATISRVSAEHYQWGDNCDGWHLVKTEKLSVIQERVPPGAGEIRHLHNIAEQFFFVISGIATIEVEGSVNTLRPMQGIHIKPGIAHQLENQGDVDLEFIVTSTPPSHGDRLLAPAFSAPSDAQS
ncbi:MAG: cupin domain-containing protein [Granulosicoccus sp.]